VIEPIPSTSPATITCSCRTCARARARVHARAHALWHLPHDFDDPEQPQQLQDRVGRAGDVAAHDDSEVEDVPQVVEVPVRARACVRARGRRARACACMRGGGYRHGTRPIATILSTASAVNMYSTMSFK
jgi:hypothetical protein